MSPHIRLAALAVVLAVAAPALAQSPEARPTEDSLFGGGGAPAQPAPDAGVAQPAPARDEDAMFGGAGAAQQQPAGTPPEGQGSSPAQQGGSREDQILGGGAGAVDRFASQEAVDDPLKIGGQLYSRANLSAQEHQPPSAARFSTPTLLDAFMDARPSDRLRGFMLARLTYDPTIDPGAGSVFSLTDTLNGTSGSASTNATTQNPSVQLDQLWLRFDILRTVFVTVGKQHVKWGTARFFNPTDFLSPQRKNPLAVFDARTGASMIKLHLPWESKGWNFYALALFDNMGPANVLGQIGGAARAEVVLGTAELGVDAVFQRGRKPHVGFDFSAGLGNFDFYGEAALRKGSDVTQYRFINGEFDPALDLRSQYEAYDSEDLRVSATGGIYYEFTYNENDVLRLGAEYFYNADGYDQISLYPALFINGAFQPFLVGKHYVGAYVLALGPGSWDNTSFTLSVLGNLSDMSYIARLNYGVRVLSFLSVEAFGAYHFGTLGGEFRLGLDQTLLIDGRPIPFKLDAPLFDLGVGLRINL